MMKNVSFGTLYTLRENSIRTPKQRAIEFKVNEIFEKREKKYGPNSGNYRNLDEVLEEDMLMDVLIIHKQNGAVRVQLADTEDECIYDTIARKAIKAKDKIGITLNENDSMKKINEKLKAYAKKCAKLAKFYNDEIPNVCSEIITRPVGDEKITIQEVLSQI